jgi:hypothetical protein
MIDAISWVINAAALAISIITAVTGAFSMTGDHLFGHLNRVVFTNLWTLPVKVAQFVFAPALYHLIDPETGHYRKPWRKWLWLLDNDEDTLLGDDPWKTYPDRCGGQDYTSKRCVVAWMRRNAAHNLMWGVLGFPNTEIVREEVRGGEPFEFFPQAYQASGRWLAWHYGVAYRAGRDHPYPEFYVAIGKLHLRSGWRSTNGREVRVRFVTSIKWL